jgi:large subunit ribosomal protein L4
MADETDETKDTPSEPETAKAKAPARAKRTDPPVGARRASPASGTDPEAEAASGTDPEADANVGARRASPSSATDPDVEEAPKPTPKRAPRKKAEEPDEGPLSVPAYDTGGERAGRAQLPESVFGQEPNMAVMHQAYLRQLANARQGTAKTKRRGEVAGGGAKPYRQKGTGRARHGSNREPSMVGGGTVFGPQPRSYAQRMPRKMRRLALRSALSAKAGERKVSVLEGFDLDQPRTKVMEDLLRAAGIEQTGLLVLPAPNEVVARSAGNLPWAKVILAHNLNLYDIFTHDQLVIAKDALGQIEETFAR